MDGLPMCHKHQGDRFYVRNCYSEYYKTIASLFNGTARDSIQKDYLTVTGTPGIGKSIFYIYFFQRWMRENPRSVLVTAAFTRDRMLKSCRVFRNSLSEPVKRSTIPDIDGALYLYDGAPDVEPDEAKMVCFTSPNISWLDSIDHAPDHKVLFMPPWTLDELQEAVYLLDRQFFPKIPIMEDRLALVAERFNTVGGSARYCLQFEELIYADERALNNFRVQFLSVSNILDQIFLITYRNQTRHPS